MNGLISILIVVVLSLSLIAATKKSYIPFYSQVDSRWRLVEMGGETCRCPRIGNCGCAVAATAMVFSYLGEDKNPRELAECLGDAACPMQWQKAVTRCGEGIVAGVKDYKFSWETLHELVVEDGEVVILGLEKDNYNNTHFIVIVDGTGYYPHNYIVYDPKDASLKDKTLNYFIKRDWNPYSIIVYEN